MREWWTAAYQESAFSLSIILDKTSSCADLSAGHGQTRNLVLEPVLASLRLRSWPAERELPSERRNTTNMNYNDMMLFLYEQEFEGSYDNEGSGGIFQGRLAESRKDAIIAAYTQHAAWTNFNIPSTDEGESATGAVGKDRPDEKKSGNNPLVHHQLGLGPELDICPWLGWMYTDKRSGENLPYYLWDLKDQCTVRSEECAGIPEYIAISHTWGRWRKRNEPALGIQGVPWTIPQNSRFDILQLPTLLANGVWETRYVWLDLVCIPQDRSNIAIKEIARQAQIFRGARHSVAWLNDVPGFDTLAAAVDWMLLQIYPLPETSTKKARRKSLIENAGDKISNEEFYRLSRNEGSFRKFSYPNVWFTSLWTLQELCLRPDMWICDFSWRRLSFKNGTPLPFNGLMAIYQEWEQLRLSADPALVEDNHPMSGGAATTALAELTDLARSTGLDRLLNMDRVDILALGDRRTCTGRRAEAIMSVIGATKWYSGADQSRREQNLVLGKYPLDFVQEVQSLIPRAFFGAIMKNSSVEWDDDDSDDDDTVDEVIVLDSGKDIDEDDNDEMNDEEDDKEDDNNNIQESKTATECDGCDDADEQADWNHTLMFSSGENLLHLRGTMLPFSDKSPDYTRADDLITAKPHESINEWSIGVLGQVHMRKACVIASNKLIPREDQQVLPSVLVGLPVRDFVAKMKEYRDQEVERDLIDLQEWIQNLPFAVHAVVVDYDGEKPTQGVGPNSRLLEGGFTLLRISGIIFRETVAGKFVKMGNFYTTGSEWDIKIPASVDVDWIVQ
ncbi:hypothetical protein K402DRAFT_394472 [Aulographum hederae CBS 113979]|uniref:Heterokaryon incompatibility domain-containing protein n=1 Tax=Aulographum hederae CBS 113979 TaxID=1176131 RepID=A0A6G1GYI9_9PEZI|nr:hypothetical protein K402DRAFT_394472 [Aulographum hederae CBS 113979]